MLNVLRRTTVLRFLNGKRRNGGASDGESGPPGEGGGKERGPGGRGEIACVCAGLGARKEMVVRGSAASTMKPALQTALHHVVCCADCVIRTVGAVHGIIGEQDIDECREGARALRGCPSTRALCLRQYRVARRKGAFAQGRQSGQHLLGFAWGILRKGPGGLSRGSSGGSLRLPRGGWGSEKRRMLELRARSKTVLSILLATHVFQE